jgi:DNA (cytosine-5)-methyltransferase 1
MQNLGYTVEYRELRACDYGAPTIRKRLFLVARCDGQPICWPEPTHGPGRLPFRTAAECIDWSLPCPSIFERARPLAPNTLRRIAAGIRRYVIEAANPFIVNLTHQGGERVEGLDEPFRTITGANRGEKALVSPTLIQTGYGERGGQAPRVPGLAKPLGTVVAGGSKHALVSAFLERHYPGDAVVPFITKFNQNSVGTAIDEPVHTITSGGHMAKTGGCAHAMGLVASSLVKLRGTCRDGQPVTDPMATISAQGTHLGEVRAFLLKYFGTDQDPRLTEPMHTLTTKHRMGLVTVEGEAYMIADIGLRMLAPRELFRAQGFPDDYIIDPIVNGKRLSKTAQVRMCGNSVSPPPAAAILRAQLAGAAKQHTA